MRLCLFGIVLILAACLVGCGGDPLDYETALNLMRERTSDPVRTSFSATPHFQNQDPAGDALTQDGVSELSLVAGRWVPASIVVRR
jgi:hypothetical protein